MYNYYREPWLINRLAGTVEEVFGHTPCLDQFTAYQSLAAITVGKDADNAVCAEGAVWDRASIAASVRRSPRPPWTTGRSCTSRNAASPSCT